MSAITPFQFDGADVRVVTDGRGEPWFVAADVARILGYTDGRKAVNALPERMRSSVSIQDGTPGNPNRATVNESGLYRLVMRSTKPEAERFQDWIAEDVLPAIRKTGGYQVPSGPELLARAVIEAQAMIAAKDEQLAIAAPKAEAFDAFLATTGDYSVNEAAKVLSRHHDILTGERRLRGWMEANGWIYREAGKPRAYQRRLDQGVLDEKAQWHYHPETGEKVLDTPQVRVTARGIEALAKALLKVADQGELEVGA